jgi:hypothetical protein
MPLLLLLLLLLWSVCVQLLVLKKEVRFREYLQGLAGFERERERENLEIEERGSF